MLVDSKATGAPISDFILPERLGSDAFRETHGIKYAYYSGAMYRGIASKELVVRMGKASLMGILGTAAMTLEEIEQDIDFIQRSLSDNYAYGVNLLCHLDKPEVEMSHVEIFLKKGVKCVEAAAFMQMTPALVLYRLRGLSLSEKNEEIMIRNKIIAKISRPETAEIFMNPPPQVIINKLLSEQKITPLQAELGLKVPMADDVCVEADSGGHTDQRNPIVLFPTIKRLQAEMNVKYAYPHKIRVGLAGGIGTPESIAAAFIMGADFVCTGSINQCTVESGMSDTVKNILQSINIQDTDYAPAGDMFKIGARVQVLKKGTFFPARANKLFMLYNHYNSLDEIPEKIRDQIQKQYFQKSFDEVFREVEAHLRSTERPHLVEKALSDSKYKMELVFVWYFHHTMLLSFAGNSASQVNFQVHT
ncbi:MAG: PfaD family polyunsaturated fatty acid/polyketide biosynthesis protein, partial [Gammaproteobacteria bacterium]|nr:PfaD family polyunsaturated fatty acid/polyketide biosynthesis protein [Gammaproteobacteria bacterium]